MVDRFAAKIGIAVVAKGCKKDKAAAFRAFAEAHGLPLARICFVGDDINDLAAMAVAGLSAAPADAQPAALAAAGVKLTRSGGHGAVRELIESLVGPLSGPLHGPGRPDPPQSLADAGRPRCPCPAGVLGLGPLVVFAIGVVVIWLPPRPPMIDLPQFAGQIALLDGLPPGDVPLRR